MSSYRLGLTGVQYDAVCWTLYIDSKVGDFRSFLSTETGLGNMESKDGKVSFRMAFGRLDVKKFIVSGKE